MRRNRPLIFNSAGLIKHGLFTVRNASASDRPAEILVYEQIGKDFFDRSGINAKDFDKALKEIPDGKQIYVRINSPGGNVWDGVAIYNMLARIRDRVTVYVDGIAASIASVIAMAGKQIVMPKSATMMIHDASGFCVGNADEMRKLADVLEQHSDQIADIYSKRGGKSKEEYRRMMKEETWMTGEDAKSNGLADVVSDDAPVFANLDLSCFRRVPGAILAQISAAARGGANNENTKLMNREQIIALLKEHGIEVANDATDQWLLDQLKQVMNKAKASKPAGEKTESPDMKSLQSALDAATAALNEIKTERDKEKKSRITNVINKAVEENRLPAAQAQKWIDRAMRDDTVLDDIAALPVVPPGAEPAAPLVDVKEEDPREISKGILALWGKGVQTLEATKTRAMQRANIISQQLCRLMPFLNAATSTNTVSSDLKRTVILQQMIRAFAIRILPLGAFSTVFNGIRLQGTDKVAVPYFPLITTASEDFVAATGYNTAHNTNSDAKTITVDKRKYQLITWTSAELSRQPFQDIGQASMLVGEQLGLDVVNNVLSAVLIAAFPGLAKSSPAGSFDSDDVADIKGVCDVANWPAGGRSLILNSAYDINLLKDAAIKSALNFGDNSPIREGRIQRIMGFDYFPDSRVPTNSEALQGFAAYKSAMLVAFAPVDPTQEVRSQLTQYELVIEPTTQAQFEYRRWGDADLDVSKQVIESNFGKIAGEAAAIQRITS